MLSRVLRRLLLSSAIITLFLCVAPKLAHAQAVITIYQEASLPRVRIDEKGNKVDVKKRAINLTPEGVSNQDCIDNVQIRFPLQLAGFQGNGTLEAWAGLSGESCSSNTSRNAVGGRVCWKLVSGIPLTINQNVDIPVRTIMSGIKSAAAPSDSAAICGTIDLTTVSVNFLYFAPGQTNDAASTKTVSVQVDTVGPSAPTGLKALPGNDRLVMQWDSISGEGGVSVLTGIQVYCDATHSTGIPNVPECQDLIKERAAAAGTGTSTTDAGDAGDASSTAAILPDGSCIEDVDATTGEAVDGSCADAGTSSNSSTGSGDSSIATDDAGLGTDGTCDSANLAPTGGTVSPTAAFNKCFSCGSITGNTGTSVAANSLRGQPLVNGTHYAISVAATDAFNNVGPLSSPKCEYPEETNDFWKDYKNDGGNAGGGCNTTGEIPLGSVAFFGTSLALVLSALRRRRKPRGSSSRVHSSEERT